MARIFNVPQESGLLVQHVVKNSPAFLAGVKGGFLKINIHDQELMIGGDIILSVDDIRFTDEKSIEKLGDYLDTVKSTFRHKITVLRAGEIIELYWISSDVDPQ